MAERLVKELSTDDEQPDDEEARESTFFRLESLGCRVGQGLAERYVGLTDWGLTWLPFTPASCACLDPRC